MNPDIIISTNPQGFQEWLQDRCGVITMSHANDLLTGGKGITRHKYLLSVAAERASGVPHASYKSWDMVRGSELEDYAMAAYQSETRAEISNVGLAYLDATKRISASPDSLTGIVGEGGIEIKCPNPDAHMKCLEEAAAPKKHLPQMNGNMWVFGARWWDFVSFCPEFIPRPLLIIRAHRDEVMIAKIKDSAERGIQEIDDMLSLVAGAEYRSRREIDGICSQALEHLASKKDEWRG